MNSRTTHGCINGKILGTGYLMGPHWNAGVVEQVWWGTSGAETRAISSLHRTETQGEAEEKNSSFCGSGARQFFGVPRSGVLKTREKVL